MFELFKLPPEIRRMIYVECLVVGKVFPYTLSESYDEYECDYDDDLTAREHAGYEAPIVALLRVCKDIYQEAEPLLYRRNTFVLPAADLTTRFFKRCLHSAARKAMIKSVVLSFDASDLTRDDRERILEQQMGVYRDDMLFPERSFTNWAEEFPQDLHDAYKSHLATRVWPQKASHVIQGLYLDNLVVDFRGADCLEGCCKMRVAGIQAMDIGFQQGMPKKLKLLGLGKARQDVREIMKAWTRRVRKWIPLPIDDDCDGLEEIRKLLGEEE